MKDNPPPSNPDPAPPNREEAIFEAALQLPAEQRAAHVTAACGHDAGLRERVEALLHAHARAGGFMEEPAAAPRSKSTIVLSLPVEENAGDRIGRYKLLQKIGEGGCGIVYMAEQEEPVRRRVALKVIKLGMDTKQVIARFEAERQALAMMDHPNIAKVLDAGATDTGRPFFVMELVRGIRITDYCDQNKLATTERLKLFVQVCNAIQHAHQKGIIHRDIKPSNILVTLHDGVPVPKVIDFGIAKATQGRLTDQTLFTAFEQFIGTPAYMSPEQAEMSGLDVDTRCDIYALGVLLYELLTGRTPFDAKELLQAGLDELRRTIREKEPERPSTRLSTMLAADLTIVAQRRHLDAPKLIHLLRGDLDWIVMKSLEKDRTRRYETANAMAMDIHRALNNEAIVARPPSTWYRFQKLARRNRLAVAAGIAVFAALALGFGMSTFLLIREREALKRANEAERVQRALTREAESQREKEAQRAVIGSHIGKGALLMTQGKIDEAESEIGQVPLPILTNYVATAAIFTVVGNQHARHGRWPGALANYSKVVAIVPSDFQGYHAVASLLAQTGDAVAYRQHCELMLQRFAQMSDAAAIDLAHDCLLLPQITNLDAVGKLIQPALAAGPAQEHWQDVQATKALLEYRRGNFAEAMDWAKNTVAETNSERYAYVTGKFLLAMARQQRKRFEDAQSSWSEAMEYFDRRIPKLAGDGLGERWNAWVAVNVLMREARSVLGGVKTAGELQKLEVEANALAALRLRATESARKGRWKEAVADFSKVQELAPGDPTWYDLAIVLVQSGDLAAYRAHRRALLARFATTTDPAVARRVSRACLLLPVEGAELMEAARLADVALEQDQEWRELAKAVAEYRQGHFTNAVEWAKKSLGRPASDRREAQTWLVVAVACRQLKETDEARAALAKSVAIIDTKLPRMDSGDLGAIWVDCVIADIFLREAKALIEGEPATSTATK